MCRVRSLSLVCFITARRPAYVKPKQNNQRLRIVHRTAVWLSVELSNVLYTSACLFLSILVRQNTGISSLCPLHGVAIAGSHHAITRTRCIWMQGDFHTWECCLFLSSPPLFPPPPLPLPRPSAARVRLVSGSWDAEIFRRSFFFFLCRHIFSETPGPGQTSNSKERTRRRDSRRTHGDRGTTPLTEWMDMRR